MANFVFQGATVRCKADWTHCVQECERREGQKEHFVCFRETSRL